MTRRQLPSKPKAHKDSEFLSQKRARLHEPHVTSLNNWVDELNSMREPKKFVPFFDPDGGGTDARILVLLECPGPQSSVHKGSGIISADNNDRTAANFFELREEAHLDRTQLVMWNIVPWYLPSSDGKQTRNASDTDLRHARPYLDELLALLPRLELVLLVGVRAAQGWRAVNSSAGGHILLPTIEIPHTSHQNLTTRPHYREQALEGMRRVSTIL